MSRTWTIPQQEAISSRKGNFIVSASAGSGKTAVLTERVYQIVEAGTPIDKLLVLTFGNAAAQEMKDRIRKKLIENGKLAEASKLDLAAIQTFDSFAYSIVKKYYYLVGLNKNIKIIDQSILDVEKRKILQQNLDILVKNPTPIFSEIMYNFCLRDYNPIFNYIYNISKSIDTCPDRDAVYKQIREEFLTEDYYKKLIDSMFTKMTELIKENFSLIDSLDFGDTYDPNKSWYGEKAKIFYENLYENSHNYDELVNYILTNNLTHPRADKTASPKEVIAKIRNNFGDIREKAQQYGTTKAILEKFNATKDQCLFLLDMAQSLDNELDKFKLKHNSFDFIDIARYALNILDNEEVLNEFRNRFEYIMVDEYQDTSDMQDAVIKKLTNDNLFLVGDVKQSIYRFRQANPDIFLKRFNDYGRGIGGHRIDLIHNFRSREEIIDDNNAIFCDLMNKKETEFDYESDHMMNSGNPFFKEYKPNQDMHHEIYLHEDAANPIMLQYETQIIISDILEKIESGYQIYDGKNGLRNVKYSDFAILIDRGTAFDSVVTNFKKKGIPIKIVGDTKVNDNPVVLSLISLFKIYTHNPETSNPDEFKHAFVSALRSFVFAYSDEEIYKIVKENNFYNHDVYARIKKLKARSNSLSISNQLKAIINEFDIANKITTLGNINENNAALNYVYSLVESMEDLTYSFDDVVNYFNEISKNEIELSNELLDESDDSVTLMTIHKSKGLQFKIVYLPHLFKQSAKDKSSSKLVFHPKYGMELGYFKCIDDLDPILSNPGNILYPYIKEKEKRENLLERVRLLYVALTRAEEKVILLYPNKEKAKAINSLSSCRSFFDFLEYAKVLEKFPIKQIDMNKLYTSTSTSDSKEEKQIKIEIRPRLTMKQDKIISSRASRSDIAEIDPEALAIGNQFHAYLELVDFNNPDISFIKDKKHQQILNIFLKNPLILGLRKTKILHEFAYYDTLNQREGIIDLISISDDTVKVIDYKTSHIDNPAYDNQIRTYVSYLKTLPVLAGKKFEGYLISIMKNQYREVDLSDL